MNVDSIPQYRSVQGNAIVRAAPITGLLRRTDAPLITVYLGTYGEDTFGPSWQERYQPKVGDWLVLHEETGARGTMDAATFTQRYTPLAD